MTIDDIRKQFMMSKLSGNVLFIAKGYLNQAYLITKINDDGIIIVRPWMGLRCQYNRHRKLPKNTRTITQKGESPWPMH